MLYDSGVLFDNAAVFDPSVVSTGGIAGIDFSCNCDCGTGTGPGGDETITCNGHNVLSPGSINVRFEGLADGCTFAAGVCANPAFTGGVLPVNNETVALLRNACTSSAGGCSICYDAGTLKPSDVLALHGLTLSESCFAVVGEEVPCPGRFKYMGTCAVGDLTIHAYLGLRLCLDLSSIADGPTTSANMSMESIYVVESAVSDTHAYYGVGFTSTTAVVDVLCNIGDVTYGCPLDDFGNPTNAISFTLSAGPAYVGSWVSGGWSIPDCCAETDYVTVHINE